jgi:hypothetical protein
MIRLKELEVDNENLPYGDSYDSYEFEKDNKKYILDLKYSYSEGDEEQSLKVKTIYEISENTKEKEKIYEYIENSSIKDYEESCYQDIFKIDKEILEDSALRLPSEKEILAKHINESHYNEEFIANQKEHYFNQFKDVFADLGVVNILVTDIEKDEFKEYTNHNDYISSTVKEELSKEFKDELSKGNIEQFENELKDKVLTKVSSDKSIKNKDKEFTKEFEKDFSENNKGREKEF